MKKLFIDCDVLLDVGLGQEPFCQASGQLIDYLEANPNSGFIAWHSVANIYYIVSKATTKEKAKSFIVKLGQFIQIVPTSNTDVLSVASLPMKDFEDALQCAAALACEADVIVTRNLEDYQQAPINAMTPTQILNALQAKQTPSED
jgi:predicted nucleic acid-binding protein